MVAEKPSADTAARLRERPDHPQTVTLVVSDQLARALKHCMRDALRTTDAGTISHPVPVYAMQPIDPSGDEAILRTGYQFDPGNGERRLSDDQIHRWLKSHGPLHEFDVPVVSFDDGSAAAQVDCDIEQSYLWSRRSAKYVLNTPRLMASAPADSVNEAAATITVVPATGTHATPSSTATAPPSPLNVINHTSVATTDTFYYERGRSSIDTFPHTAEFFDQNSHGITQAGEQNRIVWESSLVFGSTESERNRHAGILVLGVFLALIVQYAPAR